MSTLIFPRGMTADLVLEDQADFDTPATSGFQSTPLYTSNLASTEGLPDDDILGGSRNNDRDQRAAAPDLATHGGAFDVPLCLNNIGWWLKGAFGAPVTTAIAATGQIVFGSQPGVNSTITINATVFTFVSGAPSGNQIQIGANLAATLTAIVTALNGSSVPAVSAATYGQTGGTTLTIVYDTAGPAGNAYTLAASASSNGTVSGATLTGGCYQHVFTSGAEQLPSRTIGIKKRVPVSGPAIWFRNVGCIVSALRIRMDKVAGYRRVGVDLVGKLEEKVDPAVFGSITSTFALDQVAAALGQVLIDSVAVGTVKTIDATWTNGAAETGLINNSKYSSGFALDDLARWGGTIAARYQNETYWDWANDKSDKALGFSWVLGPGRSLVISAPAVQLTPFGIPITGPAAIETSATFRAHQGTSVAQLSATLKNVVSGY